LPSGRVTNSRGSYEFSSDPRGKHLSDVFSRSLPREHSDGFHPHSKPVDWMRLLIGCCGGDRPVFDPYAGSGASLLAAHQLGLQWDGYEISPAYCDVIVQRWENLTGNKAALQ